MQVKELYENVETDLLNTLDEVFENHHGIFLDKNTSIFDTLKIITAEKASIRVGNQCATLAAQVAHITFYLEQTDIYMRTGSYEEVDWNQIWRDVNHVTPTEWITLQTNLRSAYRSVVNLTSNKTSWNETTTISGLLSIIAHSAYHLGEIRQALCVLT